MLTSFTRAFFESFRGDLEHLTPDRIESIRQEPLDNLSYFMEWGAPAWEHLLRQVITKELGTEWFRGKRVLELGCRTGRISTLFALLGADVVGLDIDDRYLKFAADEAEVFGVGAKTEFKNEDLMKYCEETSSHFDLVFTKSVLVAVSDLERLIAAVKNRLVPDGVLASIENGKGDLLLRSLRKIRRLGANSFDHSTVKYFDKQRIDAFRNSFDDFQLHRVRLPPVFAFVARNRVTAQLSKPRTQTQRRSSDVQVG